MRTHPTSPHYYNAARFYGCLTGANPAGTGGELPFGLQPSSDCAVRDGQCKCINKLQLTGDTTVLVLMRRQWTLVRRWGPAAAGEGGVGWWRGGVGVGEGGVGVEAAAAQAPKPHHPRCCPVTPTTTTLRIITSNRHRRTPSPPPPSLPPLRMLPALASLAEPANPAGPGSLPCHVRRHPHRHLLERLSQVLPDHAHQGWVLKVLGDSIDQGWMWVWDTSKVWLAMCCWTCPERKLLRGA